MEKKKQAELRLLKDGVVFGPTDRQGLEKLLAAGRLTIDDRVSVRNAEWIRIGDYISAPAAPPSAPLPSVSAAAPAPRKKKGDLRVLAGGRIIASLHRDDVERLWKTARVGDDDLVCAVGGPWMRVGDFFAPPPASVTPVTQRPAAAPMPISIPVPAAPPPVPMPIAVPRPGPTPGVAPQPISPVASPPQFDAGPSPPDMASSPAAGYRVRVMPPPPTSSNDEWFVRVRGVHSSPLKKHHVKALFQAREITLDNAARHPTWSENDWRPISSIPALADIGRS